MALQDWKRTQNHPRPTTKIGLDFKDVDHLYIDYIGDMSIPYRIILNNEEIDSTGTIAKANKIASRYRRTHD